VSFLNVVTVPIQFIYLFNEESGDAVDHFWLKKHHQIGVAIFIFAVVQVSRPPAPPKPDPKCQKEESDEEAGAAEATMTEDAPVKKKHKIRTTIS